MQRRSNYCVTFLKHNLLCNTKSTPDIGCAFRIAKERYADKVGTKQKIFQNS